MSLMSTNISTNQTEVFTKRLAKYKQLIDDDIAIYSKDLKKATLQDYGARARIAVDAYLEILARGGKRIRGGLAMVGYEMMGGNNQAMILDAARAIEMIHSYILIMDDIQDNSLVRRGGPAAHVLLADYHRKNYLAGDSQHFGISLALNAMGIGNHAAQCIVSNLDVSDELRLRAASKLNEALMTTFHGQTHDIINEVIGEVSAKDVDNVLEWKTAYYTFLNPLSFGMILAGSSEEEILLIREYSLNAGRTFQITDDIMGIFGSQQESGKSPMDDIKEGKRTILTTFALGKADKADQNFLIQMLGNQDLNQAKFEKCKEILIESGALDYARREANICAHRAISSIENTQLDCSKEGKDFLVGLAGKLVDRKN